MTFKIQTEAIEDGLGLKIARKLEILDEADKLNIGALKNGDTLEGFQVGGHVGTDHKRHNNKRRNRNSAMKHRIRRKRKLTRCP